MKNKSLNQFKSINVEFSCDDFGLDLQTNLAILELAEYQKIQATSILITHAQKEALEEIRAVKEKNPAFKLKLHFNLTEGELLILKRPYSPLEIFAHLFFQTDLVGQFKEEFFSQLEKFRSFIGEPDGIDGHQHIQYLPFLYPLLGKWLKEVKLNHLPLRNGPLLGVHQGKWQVRTWALGFLSRWHGGQHPFVDLSHLLGDKNLTHELGLKNLSVMAHVAKPTTPSNLNKEVDFGSFSFENRYHQYQFLKNLKV
jgi:predicted glycoside hydrolase/deacetylase ChbG (UPF0249 family)